MAAPARYPPKLDPRSVARLRAGRVPVKWLSCGLCRRCGPVLLPGEGQDYGELPECPWCLVRRGGLAIPSLAFVRARLRERWPRLPEYFTTGHPDRSPESAPAIAVPGEMGAATVGRADPRRASPDTGSPGVLARVAAAGGAAGPEDAVGHIGEVPHHPLDAAWIEGLLARVPDPVRRSALRRRYGEIYRAALDAEPSPIRKEGRARFAANSDLREEIEGEAGKNASRSERLPTSGGASWGLRSSTLKSRASNRDRPAK
ncbi:MAG: hypothetical protein IPK64_21900 [bacterium]|nr:hypothetical protein [bacterium]